MFVGFFWTYKTSNTHTVNDVTLNTINVCITHVNALHRKYCIQLMSAMPCIANAFHFGGLYLLSCCNMAAKMNVMYTLKPPEVPRRPLHRHVQRRAALDSEEMVVLPQVYNDLSEGYDGERWTYATPTMLA